MSRYDDYDEDIERGVINDEEADDFANFDPKRYLRQRTGRPVVGDDRDEMELGVRRRARRGDDPLGTPAGRRGESTSRSRSRSRGARYERDQERDYDDERRDQGRRRTTRRTKRREGCLDLITGVLFTTAEFGSTARALLLGVGCLIAIVVIGGCLVGAWAVSSGLGR